MSVDVSTIGAALIGAIIGSLGSTFLGHYLTRKSEKRQISEKIVKRYLIQFQDYVESLWFRLANLRHDEGTLVMTEGYLIYTTIYSLAVVLAYKRIMLLEGLFAEIEHLGIDLPEFKEKLNNLDSILNKMSQKYNEVFQRYHRLGLAELVIEKREDHLTVQTYLDFQEQAMKEQKSPSFTMQHATAFIQRLTKDIETQEDLPKLMDDLKEISNMLSNITKVKSSIS